jgi:hypothetical protein
MKPAGESVMLGIVKHMINAITGSQLGTWFSALLSQIYTVIGGGSPAEGMKPIGVSIGEGIAVGMVSKPSLDALDIATLDMVDHLIAQASTEKSVLGKKLLALGNAFVTLIAKGIKNNVERIVKALSEAIQYAREQVASMSDEAARSGGADKGGGTGGRTKQSGGYVSQYSRVEPGEFVIPAMLTRAMMRPTQQTSNYYFNNNVGSNMDSAHLLATIRNVVRKEIASAV